MPFAVVLEEHVTAAHGRHVEIRVAVVVDVGKRRGHADAALDGHARRLGDVAKFPVAEILPELVAAELADEVDVGEAVSVDVGDDDSVAMVVVIGLVELPRIVGRLVRERDPALRLLVGELKLIKDSELSDCFLLRRLACREALGPRVHRGHPHLRPRFRRCCRPQADGKARRQHQPKPHVIPSSPPKCVFLLSHENRHSNRTARR